MSYILALDCSLKSLSLALLKDQTLLASFQETSDQVHSLTLLAQIDALLKKQNLTLTQINSLVFCHGPGGYTSLRVGLATLMGLFVDSEVLIRVVSSLLFRCLSAEENSDELIIYLIRAGQDKLYFAKWDKVSKQYEESLLTKSDVLQKLSSYTQKLKVIGEGLSLFDKAEFSENSLLIQQDITNPESFLKIISQACGKLMSLEQVRLNYLQEAV